MQTVKRTINFFGMVLPSRDQHSLTHQLTDLLTEQLNTLIGPKALCVNMLEISAAVSFFLITASLGLELKRRSADPEEK